MIHLNERKFREKNNLLFQNILFLEGSNSERRVPQITAPYDNVRIFKVRWRLLMFLESHMTVRRTRVWSSKRRYQRDVEELEYRPINRSCAWLVSRNSAIL